MRGQTTSPQIAANASAESATVPLFVRDALQNRGSPLPEPARAGLEAAFGHDLRHVRIHTDAKAAASALALRAHAYTVGSHVAFAHGQYAPASADGRALIAHELAHVVQQERGGPPPSPSPQAGHEADANRVAGAVVQGRTGVGVTVGTGVGLARAPEDWFDSSPHFLSWGYTALVDEIDQLEQWLAVQTDSSPESARLNEAVVVLRAEVRRRDKALATAGRRKKKRAKKKQAEAAAAEPPSRKPRVLEERTSVQYTDEAELREEIDLMIAWLQRDDLSKEDRTILQTSLANLSPSFQQNRAERAGARRTERINQALTPSADITDARARIIEGVRLVAAIRPMNERPGFSYLMQGSEMILLEDQEVENMKAAILAGFDQAHKRTHRLNGDAKDRWQMHADLNYKDSPWIGFAVSAVSGEDPMDLYERMDESRYRSYLQLSKYLRLRKTGDFVGMAESIVSAVQLADEARRVLEDGIDRSIAAAGDIVTGLTITKDLAIAIGLSLGAIAAAPIVAAGVSGLGATGAVAVGGTAVGTAGIVGTGGMVIRGGSEMAGVGLAGGSLSDAWKAAKKEGWRGLKEGAAIGVSGGVAQSVGKVVGVGAQNLGRVERVRRAVITGGSGGAAGEVTGAVLEGKSAGETLTAGVKGFGLGGLSSGFGAAASTLKNPAARKVAETATESLLGFGVAYAETGSVRDSLQSGAISAVSSTVTGRTRRSTGPGKAEQSAFAAGRNVRNKTRQVLGAVAVGVNTAIATPNVGGGVAKRPAISAPLQTSSHPAPASTRPSSTVVGEAQSSSASRPGVSGSQSQTSSATPTGPEVWAAISSELAMPTNSRRGSVGSATTEALAGGLIGAQGAPGTVDIAFGTHSSAPLTRAAYGITGQQGQSAHVGPTSFLRRVAGYSRGAALTTNLDPTHHQAFDATWSQWAVAQRRAGRTTCKVRELRDVMFQSIDQIPGLSQKTKGVLAWRLELEFHELGLELDLDVDLPYPNIPHTP